MTSYLYALYNMHPKLKPESKLSDTFKALSTGQQCPKHKIADQDFPPEEYDINVESYKDFDSPWNYDIPDIRWVHHMSPSEEEQE